MNDFQYWIGRFKLQVVRMSLREKVLVTLFVAALMGVWLTFQTERLGQTFNEMKAAKYTAKIQRDRLKDEAIVEQSYAELLQKINLNELPSVDEVNAQIDGATRKWFSDFKINTPRSDFRAPLTFHTFTIDLHKADYNKLIQFTKELKTDLSYVSLQEIKIQAPRRSPELLEVNLDLKSIEYTP